MVRLNKPSQRSSSSSENEVLSDTTPHQSTKKSSSSSGKGAATKSAAASDSTSTATAVEKKSKGANKKSSTSAQSGDVIAIDASSSSAPASADGEPIRAPRTKSSKQKKAVEGATTATDGESPAINATTATSDDIATATSTTDVLLVSGGSGEEVALLLTPLASSIQRMNAFSSTLVEMVGHMSALKNEFKQIEKVVSKEMKLMSKQNGKAISKLSGKKAKRVGAVRLPSGFVKPTCISAELAAFLGKEPSVLMSRTEVSKEINKYIRTNDLQDKTNGRRILADGPLSKLLNFNADEEELTYFNLQRYMKHHFMKLTPATAAAALALLAGAGVDAVLLEEDAAAEAVEEVN